MNSIKYDGREGNVQGWRTPGGCLVQLERQCQGLDLNFEKLGLNFEKKYIYWHMTGLLGI